MLVVLPLGRGAVFSRCELWPFCAAPWFARPASFPWAVEDWVPCWFCAVGPGVFGRIGQVPFFVRCILLLGVVLGSALGHHCALSAGSSLLIIGVLLCWTGHIKKIFDEKIIKHNTLNKPSTV
ncbi:hypothetical protein XENOCAPTIV_019776 [Xenoophorus captivus]|uniref:Transmembrane protein n=1 Tax=Xenoophorus captivus TaxID=1517983 RepID=A0ABV0QVZ0_9TELE